MFAESFSDNCIRSSAHLSIGFHPAGLGVVRCIRQFGTKQKFMKKLYHEPSIVAGRGILAFQELVRHVLGQKNLTQRQLAALLGIGPTTLTNWLAGAPQQQTDTFIRLLELVAEEERWRRLSDPRICRTTPTLRHARLNHDLTQISRLRHLVKYSRGLTVVQGGNGEMRTFLCHALANERVGSLGLDGHQPDWFVPASQVYCLDNPVDAATVVAVTDRWLKQAGRRKGQLMLFNGLLGIAPTLRSSLLHLARDHHVVLADDLKLTRPEAAALPVRPMHLLMLTGTNETIRVQFAGWA